MKRMFSYFFVCIIFFSILPIFSSGCQNGRFIIEYSEKEPPAPQHEVKPHKPGHGYDWVPGHWRSDHGRWVWVPGRWEKIPNKNKRWVPGRWQKRGRRWEWIPGHWR